MTESREPADEIPLSAILVYAAPTLGVGFMFFFVNTYLMKFATDVLLITPAAMAVIFGISRFWDAVSDPVAGYLSDRTRTRLGRRRPWLLVGAVPVGLIFVLIWSPPADLAGSALAIWMGTLIVLYYTGLTVVMMPHDSLGAELSIGYHDRNRVFGWRRFFFGIGSLAVFAALAFLTASPEEQRRNAPLVAMAAAAVTSGLFLLTGLRVRERPEYQGRGARSMRSALADIARNPHARILISVFFLQQLAVGALVTTMAYYAHYVIGDPEALSPLMASFFLASIASIPVWLALGRRFEKKSLALSAMCAVTAVMASMLVLGEGDLLPLLLVAALGGAAGGCLDVVFPSIQADVIDYDQHRTGQRKEGMYFSIWALASKTAASVAGMVVGFALSASGFEPNAEQSPQVRLVIRGLTAGVPIVCYALGTALFLRFRLDRSAHAEIRAALSATARPGSPQE